MGMALVPPVGSERNNASLSRSTRVQLTPMERDISVMCREN